jgi:hypothetical protein
MSWDIYGQPLRRGHCEAHPDVHEEYPCGMCLSESRERERAKAVAKLAALRAKVRAKTQAAVTERERRKVHTRTTELLVCGHRLMEMADCALQSSWSRDCRAALSEYVQQYRAAERALAACSKADKRKATP